MISGHVTGMNHSNLESAAKAIAAVYYDTDCVVVDLTNEGMFTTDKSLSGRVLTREFSADFTAQINHEIARPTYGPGKCRGCGKESWPDAPLPQRIQNRKAQSND